MNLLRRRGQCPDSGIVSPVVFQTRDQLCGWMNTRGKEVREGLLDFCIARCSDFICIKATLGRIYSAYNFRLQTITAGMSRQEPEVAQVESREKMNARVPISVQLSLALMQTKIPCLRDGATRSGLDLPKPVKTMKTLPPRSCPPPT